MPHFNNSAHKCINPKDFKEVDTSDLPRAPFRPYIPAPSVIVHRPGSLEYRNLPSLAERAK